MTLTKLAFAGALALASTGGAFAQTANPIVSGVQSCSASAAPLPGGALTNGVVLTADPSNSGKIYIGGPGVTAATGYPLTPGASISYGSTSLSMIYLVCANAVDTLHFTGN
ncbi:hypothetical protein K9U39_10920 [Rhodoblastus acidophilus]|uniref:Phage tail protein n=1 Tax=Candidatus Rhodoblastus alkanivorans TaxID=2954117 RepID=A0ABS9Z921_9HYPH|nr:hypothetical protein [Candidatus Rhodoblastus alkanivorans]MCI4680166.1 hypothetical protein [Candidatus Rhodoblastus alkanivorans]MCI4684123.1 hypothetical protein [Candidatus Rhodoblastus alkanivorans]MDI4641443.1 hypothetical protein [Rhodoblastus acidophilus]